MGVIKISGRIVIFMLRKFFICALLLCVGSPSFAANFKDTRKAAEAERWLEKAANSNDPEISSKAQKVLNTKYIDADGIINFR